MAITAFSLKAVNRYIHTTSSKGTDSVYKKALTVADYPFSIDQYARTIYNTDSLPSDCDLNHVLLNITASSLSGDVFLKRQGYDIDKDTLWFNYGTDSINMARPMEVLVYNSNKQQHRIYTITLNVKNKLGDNMFGWTYQPADTEGVPDDIDDRSVKIANITAGGFQLSHDGGDTWEEEFIGEDEDTTLIPVDKAFYYQELLDPVIESYYHMIVGRTSSDDTTCTVWRKISIAGAESPWACLINGKKDGSSGTDRLPSSDHISLVRGDDCVLAILDDGSVYMSKDYGLTWQKGKNYNLPAEVKDHARAAVDEYDLTRLWLMKTDTGELWRTEMTY